MKHNRQNHLTGPKAFFSQKKSNQTASNFLTNRKTSKQEQRMTLKSLLNMKDNNQISLSCNQNLDISISQCKTSFIHQLQSQFSEQKEVLINAGTHSKNALMKMVNSYEHNGPYRYIFSAVRSNEDSFSQRSKSKGRKTSANQTRQSIGSNKTIQSKKIQEKANKYRLTLEEHLSAKELPQGVNTKKKSIQIEQKYRQKSKGDMFTVLQIKQSLQSQAKQSISKLEGQQNDNTVANGPKYKTQNPHKVYFQNITNLPSNVLIQQSFKSKQVIQTQITEKADLVKPKEQIQKADCAQSKKDSGFSFAGNIKNGLIEGKKDEKLCWESFKIVGDEQIEKQRHNKDNSKQANEEININIESLSSIISNGTRQDPFKREKDEQILQMNKQFENINERQNRQMKKKETIPLIQRINASDQIKKLEDQGNQMFEVTQTEGKQGNNQFTVKYNIRFLQNKTANTQVIRISPLKFRKKDDVIHHLVKAKIVERKSDSINVPEIKKP